jgi:hypothetical protein
MSRKSAPTSEPIPRAIQRTHFVARSSVYLIFAMLVL